jgi:protein-S-isoprenylcysteine O-methyltransferase Ste14
MEERKNIEKYDQEYKDYMKRTPRYLGLDKTS